MKKLSDSEIQNRLDKLAGWQVNDDKLHKDFIFNDFATAFGFMINVAEVAERMNHHPDWSNSYNKVSIDLMTHDAGGPTENDFKLAQRIDECAAKIQ